MHQDGDQQAAPAPVPGGGLQAPPQVEPLDNIGAIGTAVAAIANDSVPMVSVLEGMAAKINILTMDNRFTKQENQQLVVEARNAKLAALVGKLTNPMSIRSVTLKGKMNDMIQDLLSTIKSNGNLCVPVSIDSTTILVKAQVVVREEMSVYAFSCVSFHVDKNKTSSYSKGAGGRGGASTRGARKGKEGRGGKGKGKTNLNQVSGGTVATVAVQKPAS